MSNLDESQFINTEKNPLREDQALKLIDQGKLREAAEIYRDLINQGTKNHIIYGNLAIICGIEGKDKEMIEIVWPINLLIALLIIGVGLILYYIFNYD